MLRLSLFFVLLTLAAIIDIRKRIVPGWIPCLVAVISLIPPEQPSLVGILSCLPLFVAAMTVGGIGGGDIKLTGACGMVLGFPKTFMGLMTALCLLLLWHAVCTVTRKVTKKDTGNGREQAYPLVPFLWIGMFISIGMGGIC